MSPRSRLRTRALVRLAALAPLLASLTVAGSVTRYGPSAVGCVQAAAAHHAALVVAHGNGTVIRICVAFSEDAISGKKMLDDAQSQAHLEYDTGYSGQAVCQIDYEPPSGTYSPQCLSAGRPYWAAFVSRGGGSWTYSNQGFASQTFRDGDAQGFRYGSDGTAPPSPSGVCPAAISSTAPTRSATPVPRTAVVATTPPASVTSAAAGSAVVPAATPAPASTGLSSADATARPATATVTTDQSAPLLGISGGWLAGALGGALLLGLALQLPGVRRRLTRRPPP